MTGSQFCAFHPQLSVTVFTCVLVYKCYFLNFTTSFCDLSSISWVGKVQFSYANMNDLSSGLCRVERNADKGI